MVLTKDREFLKLKPEDKVRICLYSDSCWNGRVIEVHSDAIIFSHPTVIRIKLKFISIHTIEPLP